MTPGSFARPPLARRNFLALSGMIPAALLCFAALLSQTRDCSALTLPVVTNAFVSVYANVTDPEGLTFAPDGTLYTGRDKAGSGGLNSDAVVINRIGPGGTPVVDFGNAAIRDPDAVVFDAAGIVSGIPGSVIVGGVDTGLNGQLSRIAPDGTVTSLFGPSPLIVNPVKFVFTAPGRLLFTDFNNLNVMEMTNATPRLFITTPDAPFSIAIDGLDRVLVSSGTASQVRLYSSSGVLVSNLFVAAKARSPLARGPGGLWGTNVFYVSTTGNLRSISPSGVVAEYGTGFAPYEDMEFGPDGALYLSDFDSDAVVRVSFEPKLTISPLPGAVQLSWTTNASGFLLETNRSIAMSSGWGVLTSNYSILATNYVVTNITSGSAQFFRLHKP